MAMTVIPLLIECINNCLPQLTNNDPLQNNSLIIYVVFINYGTGNIKIQLPPKQCIRNVFPQSVFAMFSSW